MRFFSPWRAPRLWLTLLWSLTLATVVAGWDWAERALELRAATQTILLMPQDEMPAADRDTAANRLRREPGIASVRWLAPADLSRQIERRFGDQTWREMLPVDQPDWLPWMLEAQPAATLDSIGSIESFIARRKQEGTWQIMWDGETPRRLLAMRNQTRAGLGVFAAIVVLAGIGGLLAMPWPKPGGIALWVWSALMGIAAPGAVAGGAWLAGAPLDRRAALVAMAMGFVVAGVVAPVLRQRGVGKRLDIQV